MLASAQAARMGQGGPSQDEASTSEASTPQVQPWRHYSSRATDTGILLAEEESDELEQHEADRERAIERFYKEKKKRRLLGLHRLGMLTSSAGSAYHMAHAHGCMLAILAYRTSKLYMHMHASLVHSLAQPLILS